MHNTCVQCLSIAPVYSLVIHVPVSQFFQVRCFTKAKKIPYTISICNDKPETKVSCGTSAEMGQLKRPFNQYVSLNPAG